MATENTAKDTNDRSLLQDGTSTSERFQLEEGEDDEDEEEEEEEEEEDPSDYHQYKTSRRRQIVVKVVIVGVIIILLVTTIVYFTKLRPKDKGTLKACKDGEPKFQELPGKCFSVRVAMTDESISFLDSVDACKVECLVYKWCHSVDFFGLDGECYTYSLLSSDVPGDEFVDTRGARHGLQSVDERRLHACSHYDRLCI